MHGTGGTSEIAVPARDVECPGRAGARAAHEPIGGTVESETGMGLEWQFGRCRHCCQSVSRFRRLTGASWFDRWGTLLV